MASADEVQCLREELEAKSRAASILQTDASVKARQIKRLTQAKVAAETRVQALEAKLAVTESSSSKDVEGRIQELGVELATTTARCESLEACNRSLRKTVKQREGQIEELKREMKAASKGVDVQNTGVQGNAKDMRADHQDAAIKRLEDRDTQIGEFKSESALATASSVQQASKANDVRIEQLEAERDAAKSRAERLEAVVKRIDVRVQERDNRIQELQDKLSSATASCLSKDTSTQSHIQQLEAERDAAETRAARLDSVAKRLETRLQELIEVDRLDSRFAAEEASAQRAQAQAAQQAEEALRQCRADLRAAQDKEALTLSNHKEELNSEARVVAEYRGMLTAEARSFATAELKVAAESEARIRCENKVASDFQNTQMMVTAQVKDDITQVSKCKSLEPESLETFLEPTDCGTGGSFLDECLPDDDTKLLRDQLEKLHVEVRSLTDELVDVRKHEIAKDLVIAAVEASAQSEENELIRLRELQTEMSETKADIRLESCTQHTGACSLQTIASPSRSVTSKVVDSLPQHTGACSLQTIASPSRSVVDSLPQHTNASFVQSAISPHRTATSNLVDPVPADLGGLTAPRHATFNWTAASPGKSPGCKRSPMLAVEAEELPSTPMKYTRQMTREASTPSSLSKVEEYPLTPLAKQLQDRDRDVDNLRTELSSMKVQLSSVQQELTASSSMSEMLMSQMKKSTNANLEGDTKEREDQESDIGSLRSELSSMTTRLSSAKQELSASSSVSEMLLAQLQKSEAANSEGHSKQLQRCECDISNLRLEVRTMTEELSSAQQELSAKSSVSELLVAQIKKSEDANSQSDARHKKYLEDVEAQAAMANEAYTERLSERDHALESMRSEVSSINAQLNTAKKDLSDRALVSQRLETEAQTQKLEIVGAKDQYETETKSLHLEVSSVSSQLSKVQLEKKALYQEILDRTSMVEKLEIQSQVQKSELTKAQNDPLHEIHHLHSEIGCMTSQVERLKQALREKTSMFEKLQLQTEIQKSEIVGAQSEALHKDQLNKQFQESAAKLQERGREVEKQAILTQETLSKQLQQRDSELQTFREETCQLSMSLSSARQELSDKACIVEGLEFQTSKLGSLLSSAQQDLSDRTSIVEDLEVQAQIHESEIADAQGQIEVKNKLIKHLQREVFSQKELIGIMKDAEQVYSQLCSVSATATN